jgi:hypothetical protein
MPDITQADIGRRMYQLDKEKHVERSIGMVRQNLGNEWKSFSGEDIHMLERLIGDVWVGFDRTLWEKIPFGRMTKGDVEHILDIVKFLDMDKTPRTEVLARVQKVLLEVR